MAGAPERISPRTRPLLAPAPTGLPSFLSGYFVLLGLATLAISSSLLAAVSLPPIISDHMVLKRGGAVPIWGNADPAEEVVVSMNGQTVKARADGDGQWRVELNLQNSGPGPFELVVEGKNKLVVRDVVVGEVWLASGQSNMEWALRNTSGADAEIAASANPMLRQFLVKKNPTPVPAETAEGQWIVASPETASQFTAVGYYFGKNLAQELKRPVGIINSSWGGTPSEAWTSTGSMDSVPDLKAARQKQWEAIEQFPANLKAYVEAFAAWLVRFGRVDKPFDAPAYAGPDVSADGWVKVKVPGEIAGEGFPEFGAVWLRTELQLKGGEPLALNLPVAGFESVYWNGKLLAQTDPAKFAEQQASGTRGRFTVPAADVLPGRNVLALRIYHPMARAQIPGKPQAGELSLAGDWLAKAEDGFPGDPAALESLPKQVPPPPRVQNAASYLFNGMIHPILSYAINGVIWYQGESNASRAYQYRTAFPLLITDWRKQWGQPDLPFYFCQLANYRDKLKEPAESAWAELREAQQSALALPGTGQAVLIDLGESDDIHPRNKKDVGHRLALIALAKTAGRKNAYSGPVYDSMKIEGDRIVLSFNPAGGKPVAAPLAATFPLRLAADQTAPLVRNSPSSELEGFAICGEDRKWVWADAKIEGDKVVVWSKNVPSPVAVRYAWADNPTCNLVNTDGLPAAPFRTDDFPLTTLDQKL